MRLSARLAVSLALALLVAPVSPSLAADGELTEFQARHGDLAEASLRAAATRPGPVARERPDPGEIDKEDLRKVVDRTVDVGRAWPKASEKAILTGPNPFTMDFQFEAVDHDTTSGISGFFSTPPDTMGAVGPTQFVTAQNGAYRFHSKTTGVADPALDVADTDFWPASVDPNANGGGDPRVRFDRLTDTWVIIAFDLGVGTGLANNRILIAVSDGPTITTGTVWTYYFFVPKDTVGGGADAGCLADYPMLAVDVNAFYFGANMFKISGGGGCGGGSVFGTVNTSIFVTPKASLPIAGGSVNAITTAFTDVLDQGPIWAPMPVDNYDPSATEGYVIGHDAGSDTILVLAKIANPGGTPTISYNPITVSNKNDGYANGVPYPGVPAPTGSGTSWGLDPLGFRAIGGAHVRNGRLWTAMTSSVNGPTGTLMLFPATGDRHSVVFFEIDVASETLIQDGNVHDGVTALASNPMHVYMGSVMVNGQGHAVVGATGNNTTTTAPSGVWSARRASDPLGQFFQPQVYHAGTDTGNMRHSFETDPRETRWGDYSFVSLDPCDDQTFWAIQEYQDTPAVATGGNWATAVARILSPAPTFTSANPQDITGLKVVTLQGTGFYDPPTTGMSSCRNGFEVSTSYPNLVVSSVTVVNANQVQVLLNTAGAATGNALLTLTNPDGQTDTFSLGINNGVFADGFESGDDSAWSATVP